MFSSKFLNVFKPTSNITDRCGYYLPQIWFQKKIKTKKLSRFDGGQYIYYGNGIGDIPTGLFLRPSIRRYCSGLGLGTREKVEWRDTVAEAEQLVGYPTPFLQLRWLFNDEIASNAINLRKLINSDHACLKTVKNVIVGRKSSLASPGLIILLVSKAAGYNFEINDAYFSSGVLHAQRVLAELVEMKKTAHVLRNGFQQIEEKEKNSKKYKDLPDFKKMTEWTGEHLLSTSLKKQGGLRNSEVLALITSGLKDMETGDAMGPHDNKNNPLPTPPKGDDQPVLPNWENESNLEAFALDDYLGRGIGEWILRTMLCSGSILAKGCQGAMKFARLGPEVEKEAYILGGHMALLGQLYADVSDFFTHTISYSLVGAPTTIALWEYPQIYGHVLESKLEKRPVELQQLYYAVRSTRSMLYLTKLLDDELAAVMRYSEKFPVGDAREALQKIALTLHTETLQYIE